MITNGTAVLGLGAIGPLASKPVMEGKGVLFKKFAGIDVFDIEVDETEIDRFVNVVAALEPTFGGINLEDIKAPECFEIERQLRERMNIPVFHDDQHGTAIIVAAAVHNALRLSGKKLEDVKLVTSGAGAAALACVNQLVSMGLPVENVTHPRGGLPTSISTPRRHHRRVEGAVYAGRDAGQEMDPVMPEIRRRALEPRAGLQAKRRRHRCNARLAMRLHDGNGIGEGAFEYILRPVGRRSSSV